MVIADTGYFESLTIKLVRRAYLIAFDQTLFVLALLPNLLSIRLKNVDFCGLLKKGTTGDREKELSQENLRK